MALSYGYSDESDREKAEYGELSGSAGGSAFVTAEFFDYDDAQSALEQITPYIYSHSAFIERATPYTGRDFVPDSGYVPPVFGFPPSSAPGLTSSAGLSDPYDFTVMSAPYYSSLSYIPGFYGPAVNTRIDPTPGKRYLDPNSLPAWVLQAQTIGKSRAITETLQSMLYNNGAYMATVE